MAPCLDSLSPEDCATRVLTVTETLYPTTPTWRPDGGWGGGPGWAVASAPPSDSSSANSVSVADSTWVVGTALAQTPFSTSTSQAAITATIGLASITSKPTLLTPNANSTHTDPPPSKATQIAGPMIGGLAGAGIISLLLLWCCRGKGKPRLRFKIKRKTVEDKENVQRLREVEEIAAERERALQDLENRRRERDTQARSALGSFKFGALGNDQAHTNGVEPVPTNITAPRSPRWI